MSSREKILKAITKNKPAEIPAPPAFFVESEGVDVVEKFLTVLASIGGKGQRAGSWHDVRLYLEKQVESGVEVVNGIEKLAPYNAEGYSEKAASGLQNVHTVFLKGGIAVAENAAIWLPEKNMVNRALPFICEQLVLVIGESAIVGNMHQAYSLIRVDEDGYGVFIAGPSKTADIEQSLVIGAHGPLGLQVFVLKDTI